MNWLLLALGVLVLVVVIYDVIQTALRLGQRGGPLTLHLASHVWRLALRSPRLLRVAGVLILVGIVSMWALFSWVGWTFVFSASPSSVVSSSTGVPADAIGKAYFAGYTIFTLGNGDLQPLGGWRAVTVVASASGLMIVTLAISYLVPLLSAVVEKRALAGRIALLGRNVREIARALVSPGAEEVRRELSSFPQHLLLLKERHLAYPVLHYFQSRESDSAIAPKLASLNEALILVSDGAADPDPNLVAAAQKFRSGANRLLENLEPWFVTDQPPVPDAPPLGVLSDIGVDARPHPQFQSRLEAASETRRRMRWLVQDTGWSWDDAISTQ